MRMATRSLLPIALLLSFLHNADAQGQWTSQTRSVIAGPQTFFAPQLPASLQVPHFAPDPAHPNLRFWFAPDSFEQDSVADSTPVSLWRNLARIGINSNGIQTQSASPQQSEVLMQPTYAMQPIYKKNVINGRGVVRFTRGDTAGSTGQKLEIYPNASTTAKGFASTTSNPFQNATNEWTVFMVARTTQSVGDTGSMGILSALCNTTAAEERGFHIYKTCSTCLANGGSAPACYPGKYTQFSTLGLRYGQATTILANGEVDENHCSDVCTGGCSVDAIPASCSSRWGPTGQQYLQDPDQNFRIISAKAARISGSTNVKVSMFIDGLHASTQPPGYITGNSLSNTYSTSDAGEVPPNITTLMLGAKALADGSSPAYMSGDIAELIIYNKPLTIPEMDRIGNYLARKYALPDFRINDDYKSPTRSAAASCASCAGPGPVGESGTTYDSHITPSDATYTGVIGIVNTTMQFFLSNGTANLNTTTDPLAGMIITVCNGACTTSGAAARGTAIIVSATSYGTMYQLTVSAGIVGVTQGDWYFLSGRTICGEDLGIVSTVTSTSLFRLNGTIDAKPSGTNASGGMLLSVCAGVCVRNAVTGSISNLRGVAKVVSSSASQFVTLAAPIPGVSYGDSYVLYNTHKVRLQLSSNSTGIGGISNQDNFYSFNGQYIYFRGPGQCPARGTRIISYDSASRCAYLGSAMELGNYFVNTSSPVAAADQAPDGACRGSNCKSPDTGGIGGAMPGHIASIKILSLGTSGCTVGTTLTVPSDPSGFLAVVNAVSTTGAITGITIYNHGSGFKAGSQTFAHGNVVGAVAASTVFVLATGFASSAATVNSLAGMTIFICNGVCSISSGIITNARGSSLIASNTAGVSPNITLSTPIPGVSTFDEYTLTAGPHLISSSASCLCQSGPFANSSVAYQSMTCLSALVSTWSDGQDGCAPGHYQNYLIVKDGNAQSVVQSNYFNGINTVGSAGNANSGPANGGTTFIARGAYLFPNDVHVSQAPSVTNIQLANGQDTALNAQYLKITFGKTCSMNPDAENYCLNARPETQATGCSLYNYPRGNDPAGQALTSATDFSGIGDLPEIRCLAPPGAGSQRDLNIYWHGIPLTLASWWHYSAPTVQSITPGAASYSGGTVITVTGANFGPPESWSAVSAGGAVSRKSVKAMVEIVGRGVQACQNIQWISDGQLVCTVPPLPLTKQPIDIVQHTVPVQVVVSVDKQQSSQGQSSTLIYNAVPAYFACDTSQSKDACFTCCRSSCIVDAFAQGGVAGSATMGNCDEACYAYCGYTSTA